MAPDDGPNAFCRAKSAFEGPPPPGRLCWFPWANLVQIVIDRLMRACGEGWTGLAYCLPRCKVVKRVARTEAVLGGVALPTGVQSVPRFAA